MKFASFNSVIIGLAVGSMLMACAPKSRFKPSEIKVPEVKPFQQQGDRPINVLGIDTPRPNGKNGPTTTKQDEILKKVEFALVSVQKVKVDEQETRLVTVKLKINEKDEILLKGVQDQKSENKNIIKLAAESGINNEDIEKAISICNDDECQKIETDIILKSTDLISQPKYNLETYRFAKELSQEQMKGLDALSDNEISANGRQLSGVASVIANETKVNNNPSTFLTYEFLTADGNLAFSLSGNSKECIQDLKVLKNAANSVSNAIVSAKLNVKGEQLNHVIELNVYDSDTQIKTIEIDVGAFTANATTTCIIPSSETINTTTLNNPVTPTSIQ